MQVRDRSTGNNERKHAVAEAVEYLTLFSSAKWSIDLTNTVLPILCVDNDCQTASKDSTWARWQGCAAENV